jgi:hypothetical protein
MLSAEARKDEVMVMHVHVGRGATRGALTVFPVWGEQESRVHYSANIDRLEIQELEDGPSVSTLSIGNPDDELVLVMEGQILEGGWQNRMVARSMLIAPKSWQDVDVVCVEQGRWHGSRAHDRRALRASNRVRSGLNVPGAQGEVWRRVSEYDAVYGANGTSSFTDHFDRAADRAERLIEGLHPFPGQTGVLIGIAGQPVVAEIFDNPDTLRREFDAIIRAAAMDAINLESIETPARRAHRFLDRAARVERHLETSSDVASRLVGSSDYAHVTALTWESVDVHTILTNPRHEIVRA